ncbi:MAG: sigma-70 family RNA polymerase sigma factor [Phycisphaerales bacterium]
MEPINTDSEYRDNVSLATKVFAEYGDFIRAVICSKLKNKAQADDIFQDFFISLVNKPLPADVRNIKSYLYKAISNDVVDAARRTEKYQVQIHKYHKHQNYSVNKTSFGNAILGEEEELDKMFSLIKGRLRDSESQAIALRYKGHYSIKEVADKMGVKCTSVSRYISTGLKKMREFLVEK